jgi:hypothetical protein
MARKQLKTAGDVLDALGGNARAAEALGETRFTVGMWRMRERIPAENFLNVTSLLDELGLTAHSSVFNMKELA